MQHSQDSCQPAGDSGGERASSKRPSSSCLWMDWTCSCLELGTKARTPGGGCCSCGNLRRGCCGVAARAHRFSRSGVASRKCEVYQDVCLKTLEVKPEGKGSLGMRVLPQERSADPGSACAPPSTHLGVVKEQAQTVCARRHANTNRARTCWRCLLH